MWKVCQNPTDGSKILVHLGYDIPEGYVEIMTTTDPNYIDNEKKAIVTGLGYQYDPAIPLTNYFVMKVDAIADLVYMFAVSSPAKLEEYTQAAADATAYLADMSVRQPFVAVWADAKKWTDEQAAVDILRTASIFRQALLFIRTQRLDAKEKIRRSNGRVETMQSVLSDYIQKMMILKSQLANA